MNENKFLKFLCSLPIVLIILYFIPFLGICLILVRLAIYKNNKYYKTPATLFICGLLILIPKIIDSIINMINHNLEIPYINNIVTSDVYIKLLSYSKLLITVSIIILIISFAFRKIFNTLDTGISKYIEKDMQKDYEIRKENDLKMQEKRERAQNTHVVRCPYCGSDNMLTEKTGTCKFCRRNIEYNE